MRSRDPAQHLSNDLRGDRGRPVRHPVRHLARGRRRRRGTDPPHPDPIPGQYIVTLADGVARGPAQGVLDGPSVPEVARGMALAYGLRLGHRFEHATQGFVARTDAAGARALAADPRVARIEEDARVHASGVQMNPPSWGLDRMDQRSATLDGAFRFSTDGAGIHLFVIDTGLRTTHADFAGRVDTADAYSAVGDGAGVEDCNGHGTFVTGLAAGTTYGGAKGVTIHPVRVLGCDGTGALSDVIAGVDWVTSAVEAHQKGSPKSRWRGVANMSIEAPASLTLDRSVQRSILAGVTYVVAAGNDGTDACLSSPARIDEVLTVAATDAADQRPAWSNTGPCVDLFAPGVQVTSSYLRSDTDQAAGSGTSMAAPHVTATAALLLAANDWATPADVHRMLVDERHRRRGRRPRRRHPESPALHRLPDRQRRRSAVGRLQASCRTQQRDCVFDASTSTDDDGIAAYEWSYGDGTAEIGRSKTRHRYAKDAHGALHGDPHRHRHGRPVGERDTGDRNVLVLRCLFGTLATRGSRPSALPWVRGRTASFSFREIQMLPGPSPRRPCRRGRPSPPPGTPTPTPSGRRREPAGRPPCPPRPSRSPSPGPSPRRRPGSPPPARPSGERPAASIASSSA